MRPLFILALSAPTATASFEKEVLPFFTEHCSKCHGEKKQSGDFRLDLLSRDIGTGPDTHHWLEVMENISTGDMPPDDEENLPSAEERNRIATWLSARLDEGKAARLARREPVTFHRLTREEYANTIQDLLGVTVDVADPGGLNENDLWHGFERLGPVLTLSPSHIEKYLATAQTILDEAYPENPQ